MSENQQQAGQAADNVKVLPDFEYLHECFSYDPDTGLLTWRRRPRAHFKSNLAHSMWNAHYANKTAGRNVFRREGKPHAVFIKVGRAGHNQVFLAHRIIYAMMDYAVPVGTQIDHKDGDPHNNRLSNLRLATQHQNIANQAPRKRKLDLPKGAFRVKSGYQSRIMFKGVELNLGMFKTPEAASAAYFAKAKELHGEFFREPVKQTPHASENLETP